VLHRSSHLQIIASAGSGKTEVVAQPFAQLMADSAGPAGIIAFTFTERAADELKARITARVEERLGPASLDKLGAAFVGHNHSYCFRLLQRYETSEVLHERRLLTRDGSGQPPGCGRPLRSSEGARAPDLLSTGSGAPSAHRPLLGRSAPTFPHMAPLCVKALGEGGRRLAGGGSGK
jgi:hypothetical protein